MRIQRSDGWLDDRVNASAPAWMASLVAEFGERAATLLAGPGDPEATIRPPLDRLISEVGAAFGRSVVLHSEVRDVERQVRPDYGVQVDNLLTGYVEVKAPHKSIDPSAFRGHDLKQWERQKDLPNLLYTNGTEWRLYRDAELVSDPVVLRGGALERAGSTLTAPREFESLLRQFFDWSPAPITTVPRLVKAVAPLTRLLRGDVVEQLAFERQAIAQGGSVSEQQFLGLADDWRRLLFPEATDERFADGYAQTVTFALLLATSDGVNLGETDLHGVGDRLRAHHSLMGRALQLLTDQMAAEFRISLNLLSRVIGAIDWPRIRKSKRDTYLYLYEDFLEEYDPDLRQQSGSYYTPREVVDEMVRLAEEALSTRLGRSQGFLDPEVVTIDPAMGTGTYLHSILERSAAKVEKTDGPGAVRGQIEDLAARLIGFEIQTGPFAVAELRTSDLLRRVQATPPPGGMKTYVTNTLDDPYLEIKNLASTLRAISDSRRLANKVKADTPVTVVIGNPPYRERAEGEGGWVEAGTGERGERPILDDFRADENGRFEYVLKNLYVYFWRWATWKVFDAHPADDEGIVCFITTNGYQRGPGFKGMREYLRRTTSEGWIIDLSPEGHRPDVNTRVFPGVQQTLSIGLFVRRADVDHSTPAPIHYTAIAGRRQDKYAALSALTLDSEAWRFARQGWDSPFTPAADSAWDDYPALNDLMPWTAPGVKPNRTWVYAPTRSILQARWAALSGESDLERQRSLMRETDSTRIDLAKKPLPGITTQPDQSFRTNPGTFPPAVRVAYRAFDRQWIIPDSRLIHRPSPDLWAAAQPSQVFVIEQHADQISDGPALVFAAEIPDMHTFNARGGRTLPLLHPNREANLAPGLKNALAQILDRSLLSNEDVLAYIAGVTSHPHFTQLFADELATPGVRVPITRDEALWDRAVELGSRLIWLHTYGEAFIGDDHGRPKGGIRIDGGPLCTTAVGALPSSKTYDPETCRLSIGDGVWEPVDPRVVEYAVGGKNVLDSWFAYRKANPGGRKSSPLDHLHVDRWPAEWTTELTDLLAVLTQVVDLEAAQAELLDEILAGSVVPAHELAALGVVWPTRNADRKPRYGRSETGEVGEQMML